MSLTREKNLRIAMLGHKRIPSREGGVEIVVEELASRMVSQGNTVTWYNRRGHHVSGADYDSTKIKEYNNIKLKNVWTLDKKGLAEMSSSFFAAICAAFGRYDIVHFHAEGPCFMLWLPKLFGKRCIATIHGLDHMRAKWGKFASWYIRSGEKCAAKFADEIIVLSRNVQMYFKDTYNRDTVYIPNGVTASDVAEPCEITENFGLLKDEYILYLGRLVPEKGITYLIDAYKNLNTDKKLVIAGGSSDTKAYEEELHKIAGANQSIIFTGFVQGRILAELYSNAYVYVLPSDLEGMPLSLLEAMSYGNCCVTSDIPECSDVLGEHGVTFKRGSVSDLCEKLQVLCDMPEKVIGYKEKAAEYICRKYNWDDVTERTLNLYGAGGKEYDIMTEEEEYENLAR